MAYRQSRAIEASIIEHLKTELVSAGFDNVTVEKSFARVYDAALPVICVRVTDTEHNKIEIGSDSTVRNVEVLIDVFATSDGLRLDLKDFLVSVLKSYCVFYDFTMDSGNILQKTANGYIRFLNIRDSEVNLGVDKATLDVHDRYRHLITTTITLNTVEE